MTGIPALVVSGVPTKNRGAANFAVAQDGSLIYVPGADGRGGQQRTLAWVDRGGREQEIPIDSDPYYRPRISPDGETVALDVQSSGNRDVWLWDFAAETLARVTDDAGRDSGAVWTPDGLGIILSSEREEGQGNLFRRAIDGTRREERLATSPGSQVPSDVTAAGTHVLFSGQVPDRYNDIGRLSLTSEQPEIEWLLSTPFREQNPRLSPNGRWMAYESNQSGAFEVYVRPFPNVDDDLVLVSQGGGRWPVWSPNSDELFYRTPEGMWVATFESEPRFQVRSHELLFTDPGSYRIGFNVVGHNYDIDPSGQRFLLVKLVSAASPSIVLVQNWVDELNRLVPIQ